jgi:hypothetical protein
MPGEEIAFAVFDRVLGVIGLIREGKKRRDERIDQGLYALYAALNETKAYVERLHSGKRRNRKTEWAIARLWHDASVPLRHVEPELADRCFIKGSYWMEPETWTEMKIVEKQIKLDQVMESTRKLLLRT